MTPRYRATRPRSVRWADDWADDPVDIEGRSGASIDVPEGPGPIRTGLLDADGNELVRMPEPIGFIHFEGE